jgi:hypothetical protein
MNWGAQIIEKWMHVQLGDSIGRWAAILAGLFSLFALLTTFWSNTLSLRNIWCE